ncbi:MAG: efflux RND transporter periplasmic adaptor subunit [Lacipirellulaceae bacterium]
MVRLRTLALFTPAALVSLWLSGCSKPGGGPPPGGGPVKVTVAKPLVRDVVEWDSYTGRLDAIESVEVRARVSGYLESHHFAEGQVVEPGQLLFVIDPRPFEAALAQAEAAQAEAEAQYRSAEAVTRQREADREQTVARADLAAARLKRSRPLAPSGAISEDELDVLVSEAREAEAATFAADAAIESARAGVAAAEAAIATARAAVDAAQLDLSYTRITAPVRGRVSDRRVTEGNLVSGGSIGSTLLTTIVSLDPIHCNFDADERALLKYTRLAKSGDRESSREAKNPVFAALADETGFPHRGVMDFVDNAVDRATGSIRGRAIFSNSADLLTPGMFVRLRIPGSGQRRAVLIPDSALAADQSAQIVYVVGEENKLEARKVEVGPLALGLRIVRTGLTGDETVVIKGLQRAKPGAVVESTVEELVEVEDGLPNNYDAPANDVPGSAPAAPAATPAADTPAEAPAEGLAPVARPSEGGTP